MDKFQDAYREALKELPKVTISVDEVQDELHHHKMQRQRRKILAARGCTAAVVFLLCGVGTVAAKNYRESVISVQDGGFTITSQGDWNLPEKANEPGQLADMAAFLRIGGVSSTEDAVPEEAEVEYFEPEIRDYDSVQEFLTAEELVVVVPDKALFSREFSSESVCVIENGADVYMDFMSEDAYFSLHQMDTRGYERYSSATSYGGLSCNERSFINSQGLSYIMFDTVDENGEIESVHAVISVNGWDLTVSFGGFEENEIEQVLNGLDLAVYYTE